MITTAISVRCAFKRHYKEWDYCFTVLNGGTQVIKEGYLHSAKALIKILKRRLSLYLFL